LLTRKRTEVQLLPRPPQSRLDAALGGIVAAAGRAKTLG
jgi:hypothetical protein